MPPVRNSKHSSYGSTRLPDFFLESILGQLIYRSFKGKHAFYPEEQEDFQVPERYLRSKRAKNSHPPSTQEPDRHRNSVLTLVGERRDGTQLHDADAVSSKVERLRPEGHEDPKSHLTPSERELLDVERSRGQNQDEGDFNIVTWYSNNDPANPMKSLCFCLLPISGATDKDFAAGRSSKSRS